MPTPEDLLQGSTGNTESVTSDTESSASVSISQGTEIFIVFVVRFSLGRRCVNKETGVLGNLRDGSPDL